MVPNHFFPRTLSRAALIAAQFASLSLALVSFTVRTAAQMPMVPDAPTVPTAPTLPPAAIIKEPLQPAASQEIIDERPSSQHLWIAGHWRWQEGNYVWIASHWELPPRANLTWVEPRWEKQANGYALAGGYWQETAPVATAMVDVPASPAPIASPSSPPTVVVVEQAPPPPQREYIIERPSPRHVWIDGYWGWRVGHHVWIGGHWELPPRERVEWVGPRWERHSNGYVLVEGFWRELGVSVGVSIGNAPSRDREVLVLREGPPPPRREFVNERERPSPRHVWVSGYWRHDGRAYAWVSGRWDLPPRERAAWIDPHWEHRSNGYVFVEGFWRDAGGPSIGVSIGGPGPSVGFEIREGPPPPRREFVNERERPSPRHVWVTGYWRHDGRAYVWVSGRWDLPPRERATWVEPRWEHRGNGYVFIEGSWR
jgi:hypothetical protein